EQWMHLGLDPQHYGGQIEDHLSPHERQRALRLAEAHRRRGGEVEPAQVQLARGLRRLEPRPRRGAVIVPRREISLDSRGVAGFSALVAALLEQGGDFLRAIPHESHPHPARPRRAAIERFVRHTQRLLALAFGFLVPAGHTEQELEPYARVETV